jgi:molybdopterin/thiamine biosynthesis adenylyltransferase
MTATDPGIDRAARHHALPQIGTEGQERLRSGTVLLIGLGGIGCAAASYLSSSGVGRLVLCDFDSVDETNLGRQTLYGPGDVGRLKVEAATTRLALMNPETRLAEIPHRLSGDALAEAVDQADIVLDGCDNFATRFQVSDACVRRGRTLVSGAAIRFEGQLAVFGPDYVSSPCYRCLYEEADESLDNCSGNGVFSPVPGVVGTLMAAETMKRLIGIGDAQCKLSLYDGLSGEWQKIGIRKRTDCEACGK